MAMVLDAGSKGAQVVDRHFAVKCPHCAALSGLSAISIPQYGLLHRYQPKSVGVAYQCDACKDTVFLRFQVRYDLGNNSVHIDEDYEEVERPSEGYEFIHLPEAVREDFREALACYSGSCFNAFAAMCRRTVQSASAELGAKGTAKVQKQVEDLKEMAEIDDETYEVLRVVVLAGHDGAHPHLPALSRERAEILLELMKDVLYQLFVRKAKMQEAAAKRTKAIEAARET